MEEALEDSWSSIAEFAPKFVGFLAILIIGLIVAKIIGKAVDKVLERIGFDRWVERGGVKKALDKSTFDASDIVSKLVYYALVLFVLQMAFGVFGPNPISELLTGVIAFIPKIVVAIIIIIVASAIATGAKNLIQGSLGGLPYGRLLANIAAVFILGLGIIAALEQVEVATAVTTPVLIAVLATIGGILVVGVGGGLVRPMQSRWDGWLGRMEKEAPELREQAKAASGEGQSARYQSYERPEGSLDPQGVDVVAPPYGAAPDAPTDYGTATGSGTGSGSSTTSGSDSGSDLSSGAISGSGVSGTTPDSQQEPHRDA